MLTTELAAQGIQLETPLRKKINDARHPRYVQSMMSEQRRVETVIRQLVELFRIEKVWARDLWHLTSRLTRKFLTHTMAVYLNRTQAPHSFK